MLKLRALHNKHQAIWLVEPGVKVGRSAKCDMILDQADIAPLQLVIGVKGDRLVLHNRAPALALQINGKPVPERCRLAEGDRIVLAGLELEVVDPKKERQGAPEPASPWSLKANSPALGGRVFALQSVSLVGRSEQCDIHLAAAHLSRRHAQLELVNGLLYVKDLGSANGTFLNGERVREARVRRGDELRFDTLSFGVLGPTDELDKTALRRPASPAEGRNSLRPRAGATRAPAANRRPRPEPVLTEPVQPPVKPKPWRPWLIPAVLVVLLVVLMLLP